MTHFVSVMATRRLPIASRASTLTDAHAAGSVTVSDFQLEEKDLEKAAEKLAAWDLAGAVMELVGVLGTVAGGPLAGAIAKGMASTVLRGIAKNATLRLLEEGRRIDDERESRRALAEYLWKGLSGCLTSEFQSVFDKLDSLHEDNLRNMRFTDAWLSELRDLLLRELKPSGPTDDELIRGLKQQLASTHRNLLLARLFPGESPLALSQVFVELAVADCKSGDREGLNIGGATGRSASLGELMVLSDGAQNAPRWVVLGDPGAGKSTLARHLAWKHATEHAKPDIPLILYASLPRLARDHLGPFELAEQDLRIAKGVRGNGLAEALRRLAETPNQVWLLLDSLDEVSLEHREQIHERLIDWAEAYPHVPIAVFSRRIGYEPIGGPYGGLAKVEPLNHTSQLQLLCRWGIESNRAEEILTQLGPGVCQLPLMATLLAYIVTHAQNTRQIPSNRRQLLDKAIDVLLRCNHRGKGAGIAEPDAAKKVLAALCLELHDLPEESYWTREQLTDTLAKLVDSLKERRCWRHQAWEGPERFLDLVIERAGLLVPSGASSDSWQFPHRQFYELLAAQALHVSCKDSSAILETFIRSRPFGMGPFGLARWAEVLGYACELDEEPLRVLNELAKLDDELALRALTEFAKLDGEVALRVVPELDVRDPIKAFEAVANTKWDGDFLRRLIRSWRGRGVPRDELEAWLWSMVKEQRGVEYLSFVHYALEWLLGKVDRERFFKACQRPLPEAPSTMVDIPEGEFWMGSPESERERANLEHLHSVYVGAIRMSPTAVTNAEYEQFDGDHQRWLFSGLLNEEEAQTHPVVNVSWWQARLYCAWQGGRLPTEAEWEYACRAGTQTPLSFGDDLSTEQVNYNGEPYAGGSRGQYRRKTVPVGSLPSNAWRIHEMHGNVWEWCADWFEDYSREQSVDPNGLDKGTDRVLRGGAWELRAGLSRSAFRHMSKPGRRSKTFGFRLVLAR